MTTITLGPLREDTMDWPLPTVTERDLRVFLDADGEQWQVWQKANVGPDIRVYGNADLRFGTAFYRRRA